MILRSPYPSPLSILGVPVDELDSYEAAVDRVARTIADGRKAFWVAINPQKIHRALREPELLAAINAAEVRICDGVGVSLASRILYGRPIKRCTGCDLFFHLISASASRGWRVFLLGGSAEANKQAAAKLVEKHPGLQIVGRQDGFFENSQAAIEQINRAKPDLLFVAMGSPKQELWIARHRRAIEAPFCLGVGGSFDVASGLVARAPRLFRRVGLEFLYQLITQPRRWRRQIVYFPFGFAVLCEKFRHKRAYDCRSASSKADQVE